MSLLLMFSFRVPGQKLFASGIRMVTCITASEELCRL
jgi:hypothetical protein